MAARFVEIPPGTRETKCRGCGEWIFFVPLPGGRSAPVSVAEEGAAAPTPTAPGRGVNHFTNCPAREQFRRKA